MWVNIPYFCFYIIDWWFYLCQTFVVVLRFPHILNIESWKRVSFCFPEWHVFMILIMPEPSETLEACNVCFEIFYCIWEFSCMHIYIYMHHIGTWFSQWSRHDPRNPELELINSCGFLLSTDNWGHLYASQQVLLILSPLSCPVLITCYQHLYC